jgi:hypothetical protein
MIPHTIQLHLKECVSLHFSSKACSTPSITPILTERKIGCLFTDSQNKWSKLKQSLWSCAVFRSICRVLQFHSHSNIRFTEDYFVFWNVMPCSLMFIQHLPNYTTLWLRRPSQSVMGISSHLFHWYHFMQKSYVKPSSLLLHFVHLSKTSYHPKMSGSYTSGAPGSGLHFWLILLMVEN